MTRDEVVHIGGFPTRFGQGEEPAAGGQGPSGRGIVFGEMICRLVARTVASQLNAKVEKAVAPLQFTVTTRCGGAWHTSSKP